MNLNILKLFIAIDVVFVDAILSPQSIGVLVKDSDFWGLDQMNDYVFSRNKPIV